MRDDDPKEGRKKLTHFFHERLDLCVYQRKIECGKVCKRRFDIVQLVEVVSLCVPYNIYIEHRVYNSKCILEKFDYF